MTHVRPRLLIARCSGRGCGLVEDQWEVLGPELSPWVRQAGRGCTWVYIGTPCRDSFTCGLGVSPEILIWVLGDIGMCIFTSILPCDSNGHSLRSSSRKEQRLWNVRMKQDLERLKNFKFNVNI